MNSALPRISQPVSSLKDLSRMSGVHADRPGEAVRHCHGEILGFEYRAPLRLGPQ
jgi:hypothetical protein